jgi:hypothetical protein
MEVCLLQVAIFSVRFICMFYVKNPTALQDDFWHLFINIWTLGCSLISQTVYVIFPGKSPLNYYICLGEYPIVEQGIQVKTNIPHLFAGLLSVIVFIGAKFPKRKIEPIQEVSSKIAKNTQTLFTFTTYWALLVLVFFFSFIPLKINVLEGEDLDSYPNYILVYTIHHYFPQIIISALTLTFFKGKPLMRKKVWSKIKETFNA